MPSGNSDSRPSMRARRVGSAGPRLLRWRRGSGQDLIRIRRTAKGPTERVLLPVRFAPMTGEARKPRAYVP